MGWDQDLRVLTERVAGPLFTRPEPRATFADLVRRVLADVARKNSWQCGANPDCPRPGQELPAQLRAADSSSPMRRPRN